MRLYYMTSLKTAAEYILPERRMRCGRLGKLNDPFELRCFNFGAKEERALFRPLLEHLHKTTGVICFGKHWKSPVMWGHYADSHRGVCLGFDVQPDNLVHEMQYVPERVAWKVDVTKPIHGANEELLKLMMTAKYDAWKYEEEWRLYAGLQDPVNGSYYIEFGENLTLREVIIGASCTTPVGTIKKLVGDVNQTVEIFKARPAFETFTMVRQKAVKPIVVKPRKH
jgi:hypothetical protein